MRQALGPGALGRPRGIGWRGRWEGGIRMGNTCKSMADSFQYMTNPLQYCKVTSLQLIKIIKKKVSKYFRPHNKISVTTIQVCHFSAKAAINKT